MRKIIMLALLLFGSNSFAQSDNLNHNRKEAIRLDSIGEVLRNSKEYKGAIDIFDKAIEADSTYGNAIYHRALSLASYGSRSCTPINICDEFKRALKYGAIIDEPTLFFYGCKDLILKKRNRKF